MSKTIVYNNIIEEIINQFEIWYMINPTLHVNKVFRYQVETSIKEMFHQSTIEGLRHFMIKKIHALFH